LLGGWRLLISGPRHHAKTIYLFRYIRGCRGFSDASTALVIQGYRIINTVRVHNGIASGGLAMFSGRSRYQQSSEPHMRVKPPCVRSSFACAS
jgi:hypothetical protein